MFAFFCSHTKLSLMTALKVIKIDREDLELQITFLSIMVLVKGTITSYCFANLGVFNISSDEKDIS